MLIEAKDQVPRGSWGRWVSNNFNLSHRTANVYMQWAAHHMEQIRRPSAQYTTMREMTGGTERRREQRQAKQEQQFRRTREIARDDSTQERQSRDHENELQRDLAAQLIDLGYRAMATRSMVLA